MTDTRRQSSRRLTSEVDLDGGQPGDLQRVADRVGVVRPRARVEHDRVAEALKPVQVLDELALGIGLEEAHVEAEVAREALDAHLELGVGQRAVVLARSAAELVAVDAVHDLDAVVRPGAHGMANSATAARRSSGSTGWPWRTSPGASTRTK